MDSSINHQLVMHQQMHGARPPTNRPTMGRHDAQTTTAAQATTPTAAAAASSRPAAAATSASTPSSVVSSSSLVGSCHQTMASCLVDLLNTVTEVQQARATQKRQLEERRKRQAAAALLAEKHAAQAHQLAEEASMSRGVHALHARSQSMTHSHHALTPTAAALAATQAAAAAAAAKEAEQNEKGAAAATAALSSFAAQFHLLSHLVPSLPISSLTHLAHFLQPTPIYGVAGDQLGEEAIAAKEAGAHAVQSGAMAWAFPQLEGAIQVALVELLIRVLLQLVYLKTEAELDQFAEEEAAAWSRSRSGKVSQSSSFRAAGEGDAKEGEPGLAHLASWSFDQCVEAPSTPSAAALCQIRLLHVLRAFSGHYRLSYVVPRCVDYSNWLACAVAMESCTPSATQPSTIQSRPPVNSVLLAAGSLPDINLAYVSDAMEARLKHCSDVRLPRWQEWRAGRSGGDGVEKGPIGGKCGVPMIVQDAIPPLPADAWLSFDEFAVETAHLLLQLVSTHLICVSSASEQARLIALLMRGWREWDLPSLVLESMFLAHLTSLADALSMLAFQKRERPGEQPAAAAGPPAPILSAKLYLALTHYRLHQMQRSVASSVSSASGSSSLSLVSAGLPTSGPPSHSQLHRIWTEVLANLNRDQDGSTGGLSSLSSLSNGSTGLSSLSSSAPSGLGVGGHSIVFRGVHMPAPIGGGSMKMARSISSAKRDTGSQAHQQHHPFVVFSCGHSYTKHDFFGAAVPDLLHQLSALQPPIPITATFLQAEYAQLDADGRGAHDECDDDDDEDEDEAAEATTSRSVQLACPSCVYGTLVQLHQKHDIARQQSAQQVALHSKQSHQRHTPLSSSGVSPLGVSPARAVTPAAIGVGHAMAPAAGTAFNFLHQQQGQMQSYSPTHPSSPHSRWQASRPKAQQFGNVSSADLASGY